MKTIKRKLCTILCAALLVGALVPTVSAASFSDVSGHWAASYIETCAGLGIVDGVGGGKFDPEGKVTNAQFIKMLCAAFYSMEEQTFESENRDAISTYFNGFTQWYSAKSYYFDQMGLLTNVDYDIQSSASANQPMNRTNMAQVAANVLGQKGIAANESDKSLAQAKLTYVNDYYNIPENNRDAVKTCYALGVITGTDGGKFDGGNTMTRAQACTVITRLLKVVGNGPTDPGVNEIPVTPTVKDIAVTTKTTSNNNTVYNIADNGCPTGYLNNGKPITEENVIELLIKAKDIWPDGMVWATQKRDTGNNFYGSYEHPVSSAMIGRETSTQYGCGAYSAMISDYLFGSQNNPFHQVDISNVRPGDTIVWLNSDGTAKHVVTVVDTVKTGNRAGAIFITDGNVWHDNPDYDGKVRWPDNWPDDMGEPWMIWNAWLPDQMGPCIAYSRWPQ